MKFFVAFAGILAIASAQIGNRQPTRPPPPPVRPTAAPARPSIAAAARVASNDRDAKTIRYDNESGPDGSFAYAIETDNGIAAQARGTPRDFGGNPPIIPDVIDGEFFWISPEGEQIDIAYIADENGYQPTGAAIPTPPPIPEAIARALDYLARVAPQKKK